jgi:hypothetical protein
MILKNDYLQSAMLRQAVRKLRLERSQLRTDSSYLWLSILLEKTGKDFLQN